MLKNKFLIGSILATFVFSTHVTPVNALELDEDTRTVTLDTKGNTVIITAEQAKRGKRLFNNACGTCHVGGVTKTNPNVGLDVESLSLATPPKDNVTNLVAYFKDPLTYDGTDSISETACLLGGTLGNGWDRWRLGYVVDFLALVPINFPIFNGADIAINLAVLCFGLDFWLNRHDGAHG
jgi:cytochrome c-550